MPSIEQYNKIITGFTSLQEAQTWLLSLGEQVPLHPDLRLKQNYVRGCQSFVWVDGVVIDNCCEFRLDSDSRIAKGICKILMDCFNGLNPQQVLAINFQQFSNVAKTLSVQRQRGLQALINKIHNIAKNS
jgi:cysteine desulfuration protein SufE